MLKIMRYYLLLDELIWSQLKNFNFKLLIRDISLFMIVVFDWFNHKIYKSRIDELRSLKMLLMKFWNSWKLIIIPDFYLTKIFYGALIYRKDTLPNFYFPVVFISKVMDFQRICVCTGLWFQEMRRRNKYIKKIVECF